MWGDLIAALGLVLVLEGILPFLRPQAWRETMRQAAELEDRVLRGVGLVAMLAGVGLIYLVRGG